MMARRHPPLAPGTLHPPNTRPHAPGQYPGVTRCQTRQNRTWKRLGHLVIRWFSLGSDRPAVRVGNSSRPGTPEVAPENTAAREGSKLFQRRGVPTFALGPLAPRHLRVLRVTGVNLPGDHHATASPFLATTDRFLLPAPPPKTQMRLVSRSVSAKSCPVPTHLSRTARLRRGVRNALNRNWRRALRLREQLRLSEEALDLLLAAGVGILGAVVNLVFLTGTEALMGLLLRYEGDPALVAPVLPGWERVLAPVFGGLVAGFTLSIGLRFAGSAAAGGLLEAVAVGDGRLPFRASLVKGISSLISIATGGSIGREGAITQLTAMLASKLGQLVRWPPYRLRMLAACGAAAGIAAPYNAPISGAVFAALVVLGNFSMTVFAPLVLASVIACVVSRSLFGIHAVYSAPDFEFTHLSQLPLFVVVGLLSGGLGAGFLRLIRTSKHLFERLPLPLHFRMALGGAIVGTIALVYPEVWGNGSVAANHILRGLPNDPVWLFLIGLFTAKLVATLATVGSGAVGGVFTPTLFLGTALGSLCGELAHRAGIALALPTPAFALVGMGSVLAATTHSPLLAMILVFEISLNYSLMPALMLGCVISSVVARRLHPFSIYTDSARLHTLASERENPIPATATARTVGEFMREPIPPLPETATLREIADRFLSSPNNFLPVVNRDHRLVGMVALQDLKGFLGAGDELRAIIAYDVLRPTPVFLTPSQPLSEAFESVLRSELQNIPVVSSRTEMRLVGSLHRTEVLAAFTEAIARAEPTRN